MHVSTVEMGAPTVASTPDGGQPQRSSTFRSSEVIRKEKGGAVMRRDQAIAVRDCWVLDPRMPMMPRWEILIAICILFTAFVTPTEVAFLPPPHSSSDPLFVVNRVVDVVFIIDIVVNFVTMYEEEHETGTRWVSSPGKIASRYLRGWFLIDFLATSISIIDVALFMVGRAGTATRFVKVIRALRMVKLVRLFRSASIVGHFENRIEVRQCATARRSPPHPHLDACRCGDSRACCPHESQVNYGLVALVRVFFVVVLGSHLCACLWMLQVDLFARSRIESWLGDAALCWADNRTSLYELGYADCAPAEELYVTSLYWSVMTITSIGYGDVGPVLLSEKLMATFIMLAASFLWGYVVATFCSIIATLNPEAIEFRCARAQRAPCLTHRCLGPPPASCAMRLHHLTRGSSVFQSGDVRARPLCGRVAGAPWTISTASCDGSGSHTRCAPGCENTSTRQST
jgi:hypothetical protein